MVCFYLQESSTLLLLCFLALKYQKVFACIGCDASTWPSADECDKGIVFTACSVSASNFGTCFADAIKKDMLLLKHGNKKLGLASIDPLFVKEMDIDFPMQQKIHLSDLVVTGLSNVTVDNLARKNDNLLTSIIAFQFFIPDFKITAKYTLAGPWGLPFGSGTCIINMLDYRAAFELDSLITADQDGTRFATFTGSRSKFINASSVKVQLSHLGSSPVELNLAAVDMNAAFKKAIEKKQAEINYVYSIQIYQYSPPLDRWFASNQTGSFEACLQPRPRETVSCVDVCGRGF